MTSRDFTSSERQTVLRLAFVFALRMLGLFLILPVLAEYARTLPGGERETAIGLAMGSYGLTQALLLLPFGWASDRWGRKPVIVAGLTLFVLGGVWAAFAASVMELALARAVQGAGAISAAVSALVADLTRPEVRTRAMAMIGATIGVTFAASMALAPLLFRALGMDGMFLLTAALGLMAIAMVVRGVPPPPSPVATATEGTPTVGWLSVLTDARLWRLYLGVFALHALQMALWVVVPAQLVLAGLPLPQQWWVYGIAVVVSLVVMMPAIIAAERHGRLPTVYRGAIVALAVANVGLAAAQGVLAPMTVALTVFFAGFMVLEATQPSWLSRLAPASHKGSALGIYNTLQSLGLFVGGVGGGWIAHWGGATAVYLVAAAVAAAWWGLAVAPKTKERSHGIGQ